MARGPRGTARKAAGWQADARVRRVVEVMRGLPGDKPGDVLYGIGAAFGDGFAACSGIVQFLREAYGIEAGVVAWCGQTDRWSARRSIAMHVGDHCITLAGKVEVFRRSNWREVCMHSGTRQDSVCVQVMAHAQAWQQAQTLLAQAAPARMRRRA